MLDNETTIIETFGYEQWLEQQQYIKKKQEQCFIHRPLNTYDDCWQDVYKWSCFAEDNSHHNLIIFEKYRTDYLKYPIEFQMKLLLDMYTYEIYGMNLRKFNAVLRKIYKAEPIEIKQQRTKQVIKELANLNLIQYDENSKEYITVYRGVNQKSVSYNIAVSWTYSIDIARFFGSRLAICNDDKTYRVLQGKIYLKDILKIEHDRSEDEIIAFPNKAFDVSVIEKYNALNTTFKNPDFNEEFAEL